jgi:hypothetical protein
LARTLALWGGGGAAAGYFRQLTWLQDHRFVYWGDLDPCGLNILAQIRAAVPTVRSVLMDEAALRAQAQHLVAAKLPSGKVALAHLQSGETDALNILLHEQKGVEQERLLFSECMAAVEAALQ